MTLLLQAESAEFSYLPENTGTTKGNLSFQISKLEEAGYLKVIKSFRKKYPLTTLKITEKGVDAYEKYIKAISNYFKISGKNVD